MWFKSVRYKVRHLGSEDGQYNLKTDKFKRTIIKVGSVELAAIIVL